MQVDDAVERVVGVLQRHPLPDRAQVVPEMERVGRRLDTGQHSRARSGHGSIVSVTLPTDLALQPPASCAGVPDEAATDSAVDAGAGRDPQPGDPATVELEHGDTAVGYVDESPRPGEVAEPVHDEAGHGLVRSLGQYQAGLLGEVVNVEQAIDLDNAADQPPGGLAAASYSSRMSPTSSSTRSSSVTMPAVPPYSSITIARWAPSRRISESDGQHLLGVQADHRHVPARLPASSG